MIHKYTYKDLTWVDLESPTPEEVKSIIGEYAIHPEVAHELLTPSVRQRIEAFPNYLFIILNFPAIHRNRDKDLKSQEVDFIVGKDVIITTRYDIVDPLHKFSRIFEVNSVLDKSNLGDHAGYIFYYMLMRIYQSLSDETYAIRDTLDSIESGIFKGEERKMLTLLSQTSRDIIDFKQALVHHKEILTALQEHSKELFGKSYATSVTNLINEFSKISYSVDSLKDILIELRETNNSLLTTKQNEIVKNFTILAFLTFPITLIVTILAINAQDNPLTHIQYHFWSIVAVVILLTLAMFTYFRKKKWL